MTDDVAYGEAPEPDDPWVSAARELMPDRSLTRVGSTARFTVSTVAVVGTALTGLGLVSTDKLAEHPATAVLAVIVVVLTTAAVVLALVYLTVRSRPVNLNDEEQVKAWYEGQLRRTGLVSAASGLLVVAVVLAGVIALAVFWLSRQDDEPRVSLGVVGTGDSRTVTATATLTGVEEGQVVALEVTGADPGAQDDVRLISHHTLADDAGDLSLTTGAEDVPAFDSYSLELLIDDEGEASLTVPG